jgi:hypothetical protein
MPTTIAGAMSRLVGGLFASNRSLYMDPQQYSNRASIPAQGVQRTEYVKYNGTNTLPTFMTNAQGVWGEAHYNGQNLNTIPCLAEAHGMIDVYSSDNIKKPTDVVCLVPQSPNSASIYVARADALSNFTVVNNVSNQVDFMQTSSAQPTLNTGDDWTAHLPLRIFSSKEPASMTPASMMWMPPR